jgi:hypothetical protein
MNHNPISRNNDYDLVIVVCEQKDLKIWKTASRSIVKYLMAKKYLLIVPDNQYSFFAENTPQNFEIINESKLWKNWKHNFDKAISTKAPNRKGWYLQQLLKLTAAYEYSHNERILIWDADTVPLRKIRLFQPNGKITFVPGVEYHDPYFSNIQLLLGLERNVHFSFISQCFPIGGEHIVAFANEIEKLHGVNWIDAIVDCINPAELSGFSEYEALGTFISNRYPNTVGISKIKWLRHGYWLTNHEELSKRLLFKILLWKYSYISFETWDKNSFSLKTKFKYWLKFTFGLYGKH